MTPGLIPMVGMPRVKHPRPMTFVASGTVVRGRLPGLDLARFIAIVGMVLVHARSDLTADPASATAPWLEATQAVATNRARILFFLLAGIGVALFVRRRNVGAGVLLRRALFLTALGAALVLAGWSDLVLIFYGVLFVVAVVLVKLTDRVLVVVAAVVAVPGLLRLAVNPSADDTLTNVLLVLGEMVPLFCLGLVIGRADLADRSVLRKVGTVGTLLAVPGLVALAFSGGLDVAHVEGRIEPVAALLSTTGLCMLVLVACLTLVPGESGRWSPLVVAGGMPLSGYVGHALLFPLLARFTDLSLGQSTLVAVGYLLAVVLVATPWRRWRGSGPVEALMRRVSGPRRDGASFLGSATR